ncbi:hypothetical protein PATSB16_22340 [Pandoraea thiooxydans]|uniref:Uncharacterized protein n=1 Tax=Pandoraea thiooxydans TaxID=445709 RepID=A0A0G3EU60_9BURK|nr:hypothetical protein ABW99_08570 [Pandoraea thiooxydans]APR95574.1 hypothetical protein PATSB16_22340 [Pandoraea thiooxydans]
MTWKILLGKAAGAGRGVSFSGAGKGSPDPFSASRPSAGLWLPRFFDGFSTYNLLPSNEIFVSINKFMVMK